MRRFAVLLHDCTTQEPIAVHSLLGEYHWQAIDAQHVLLLGHMHLNRVATLDQHPDVLLLPSIFSSKTVFCHAEERQKSQFCLPLSRCLALQPHHQTLHLAELALDFYGKVFALDV